MWFSEESSSITSSKLTYQWRMDPLKMYFLLKIGVSSQLCCFTKRVVNFPNMFFVAVRDRIPSWTWHVS